MLRVDAQSKARKTAMVANSVRFLPSQKVCGADGLTGALTAVGITDKGRLITGSSVVRTGHGGRGFASSCARIPGAAKASIEATQRLKTKDAICVTFGQLPPKSCWHCTCTGWNCDLITCACDARHFPLFKLIPYNWMSHPIFCGGV